MPAEWLAGTDAPQQVAVEPGPFHERVVHGRGVYRHRRPLIQAVAGQLSVDGPTGQWQAADIDGHLEVERAGRQVIVQGGVGSEVGDVDRIGGVQVDRARDAAVPPLVLVLHEVRVGPLDDSQAEGVAARDQVLRDVELGREVGSPCRCPRPGR